MRGKVAKTLRRKAREMSQGLPERGLLGFKVSESIVAINNPRSTRGIYRQLKKLFKRRRIS